MAGITRRYTSLNQIVADEAFSNSLFREEDYNKAKETGTDVDYLLAMANTKDNVAETFDRTVYDRLSDDDRFNYFVHKNYGEVGSKQYNDTELYFNNQIEQIKKQEIYDNLSGFDKTVNSVGGLLANVGLQFVGIVENLVDAAPALVGQIAGLFGDDATFQASKEFVAKDITGYSAAQQQLNDYLNTYTFVDKNWFTKGLNDVLTGITRMTPMLVGNLLAPVTGGISAGIGNFMYYSSLYGSSAEELYSKNIDASWFDSLIYTGGTVGLEALTEWTSAKLFGGSWFDPVNPSLQKGSLSKFGKDLWHDMWTESVEEAVSEIFGGMLYQKYIDPQKETSLQDILYAAIIGGITGGILSGGKAVFGTTRYAVYNGNIVDVKSLTEEQLKSAKKLGFGKSYELDSRITETIQTLDKINNVSNLQAKYKTLSLDQIKSQHADEYKKAVDKDAELNKNKSTVVLGLAQFLSTIGEENFVKAIDTLKTYSQQVEEMVTNFINHTDTYNKTASAVFSEVNPGKSFTPTAIPTNSEQLLAKTLREAFPKMKVVFGQFGSEDGLSVSSVNGTEGWLFIESGLVDSKGFDSVLGESIRNELAREILDDLADLTPEHADALATLITGKATKYDDLTQQEKTNIAKIICFDPVSNRRIFQRDNKVHSKIFKSLSNKAEYVKRFGRQTKANKIRYHDLLEIRNTFFDSIAKTISNSEDVAFVEDEYALLADEIKTKIIDKTIETRLNRYVKLTALNQSKETIMRKEAYIELSDARKSQEGDFDFTRLYDKSYYKDEYVNSLTQNTTDFKMALDDHLKNTYETNFSTRPTYIKLLKDNLSEETLRKAANVLLTKEFLESNPDYETLQNQVAEQLWFLMVFGTQDPKADSITLTENQIKGAGKLKFIISEVTDGKRILSEEQRREDGESSGEQTKRLAPNTAKYENKLLETAALRVQTEDSLDEHQRKLKNDYKQKYNLDLKFFIGNISYRGQVLDNANGLVSDNTVYLKYDGTLTDTEIDYVLEHEATHKMFAADEKAFEEIKSVIEDYVDRQEYNETFRHYASDEMYGKIYDHDIDAIKEELINDIIVGEVTLSYSAVNEVNKKIEQFKERSTSKLSGKIERGIKFSINKDTKNIVNSTKATSPKQIADSITSLVANSPIAYSESKGFEGAEMEYTKVAQSMIDENFSLFRKVTQKNYQQIRDEIANTNLPYTEQALLIFDRALFTYAEDSSRFDAETQEKIKNQARQKQTISAQWQGLQSRRFADKTSLTEVKNKFAEQGIDVSISDEMIAKYVPEMKNKKEFVAQIDKNISEIEQKIEKANDDLEKAALNKQLKDETDKRIVIEKGTNEEILDWAITNEDIVSRASKIQRDVFEQMVETAELAEKTEGKKALTILVDEKTGLPKPFPKTTQFVQKAVKGLKSFRMWAMLTSPVSWVRNWVGNAGMTALDKATNQFEKFLTNRQSKVDIASLEKQQKVLQNKKDLTPTEQAKLADLNAQITRAYDFKFVETTASKELKQQIAKEYEAVFKQILNGEDVSKYEGSAEKAGAIARAERDITRKSENANFVQKVWAACQSMTDWGLNTGVFGDNAVVLNSLVRNFANMVESNKPYLIKSLTAEYGKDGSGMSDARKVLVEKALKTKDSMDIINAMSKADVELFMDSCKQRTFEQYFKNTNWLSKWASNLSQKHPIAASLTSLVLPFPKVAANVLTMAYKYSPLGFISALRQWSVVKQMDAEGYKGYRDAFARAKLNRTTAQATVGTMMCIAGLILASLGAIDIEEDDYMGPSLRIGDLRISLSDLAPSMTTLSVGAGMMWAWKNDKSGALTALDVLYDNTLLGNIENVFKYGSPDKYIENLSINYVSQYVPAMLKLFAKITTNQEMIDKSGTYFEKLWKTFGSGIPGIAHALPKRVNPYTGEFLTNTGSQNVFFNFIEALSPLDFETTVKSPTQKEAERLNTKSTGLSGTFKVNDKEYVIDKVSYSKYRANYIQNNFEKILSGKQKVTVEDEDGKRITTTYDKLTDKQKKNVIDRLYTEATSITKIQWWIDQGNKYVVTNEDLYRQYRSLFNNTNIIYRKTWTKSKFVES